MTENNEETVITFACYVSLCRYRKDSHVFRDIAVHLIMIPTIISYEYVI